MKSKEPDVLKLALRLAHDHYWYGFWTGRSKTQKIDDYKIIIEVDKQRLLDCIERMKA